MEVAVFTCSICGDPSHDICVYCTKDACAIHLCDRCHRCSDCCVCDQPQIREDVIVPEEPVLPELTHS